MLMHDVKICVKLFLLFFVRISIQRRKRSSNAGSGESRRRHGRHGVRRSHFDSSSESSDGGAGFADHDRGFDRYQRKVGAIVNRKHYLGTQRCGKLELLTGSFVYPTEAIRAGGTI